MIDERVAPGISTEGLTRRFGAVTAVDSLDLVVPRGALFGLVGPDGAGKSTLIRMLATVIAPTSGDAFVLGRSVVDEEQAVKPLIGYMSQRFSLYPDLSVAENLAFFAELRRVPRGEIASRSSALLQSSGLSDFSARQAQFLSGGMKQKLALSATLIHEPEVLLLDEPTTGVDPVSRREFWRILSGLHQQGKTIFVATQYMDEVERCEMVAFMNEGRLLFRDTPAGIKARIPGRLIEVAVPGRGREAAQVLRGLPYVTSVEVFGETLQVLVDCPPGCEGEMADALKSAGLQPETLRETGISMEMAFAQLARTGESARA